MTKQKLFCKNGGCSAKLGAKALDHILSKLPRKQDEIDIRIVIKKMMLLFIK